MNTAILKKEVEDFASQMQLENLFFQRISSGEFTPRQLVKFLYTAYYLVLHTPIHLQLAKDISEQNKNERLKEFYRNKIKEELGHQMWAVDDIRNASLKYNENMIPDPAPAVIALTLYIKEQISIHPSLYLPYIFLAEYFTVLAGPQWLYKLETKCGIPKSLVSIIGKHVELDIEHTQDDLEELEEVLSANPSDRYRQAFNTYLDFYDQIYHEIGVSK